MSWKDYKFSWKPDLPDQRDFRRSSFSLASPKLKTVYLSSKYHLPLPYDQDYLGSCTANAIAFLVHFDLINKNDVVKVAPFMPSRLFIYYYERFIEGTIDQDAGAELRDGLKVTADYGVPPETIWPYDETKFKDEPISEAIKQATKFTSLKYFRLDNTNKQLLVSCLMQGYPICFGMTVYESFMSDQVAKTGIVPMPLMTENIEGGHAMAIVGYNAQQDYFVVRNSWGTSWGQKGYCRIPAAYLTNNNLADDFWYISQIQ